MFGASCINVARTEPTCSPPCPKERGSAETLETDRFCGRRRSHEAEAHGYDSVAKMRGCMSLEKSPNPAAVERANYIRILQGGTRYA